MPLPYYNYVHHQPANLYLTYITLYNRPKNMLSL